MTKDELRLMLAEANPKMEALADQGPRALGRYKLKVIPVGTPHFSGAFRRVRPQTDPQLLERFRQWRSRMS